MAAKKKKTEKKEEKELSIVEKRAKMRQECAKNILKSFGKGTTVRASETSFQPLKRISSGCFSLDHALGGGWPRGRVSVIWGPRSCNKTTLMIKMIADAQMRDAVTNQYIWEMENKKDYIPVQVAWVDVEGTLDLAWAKANGVDLSRLEVGRPDTQEQAADMVEAYMSSGFDIVVLDSLAAMTPVVEMTSSMSDQQMGVAARNNNKMFRKVQMVINRVENEGDGLEPTLFVVNQERTKVGISFGDPRVKPGGRGQDFLSSIEVMVWGNNVEFYDSDKKMPKWTNFSYRVSKNKTAPPMIEGQYKMALVDDYDDKFKKTEIIEADDVLNFAERLGIFENRDKDWRMYDKTFKRKMDLVAEYVENKENYLLLKQDLMKRLFPNTLGRVDEKKEEG